MKAGEPVNRFVTRIPRERFEPAMGEATVSGLAVEIDDGSGLAVQVAPLRIGGVLSETMPAFWGEPSAGAAGAG
jgi:calcineurin-like phosphoesterase